MNNKVGWNNTAFRVPMYGTNYTFYNSLTGIHNTYCNTIRKDKEKIIANKNAPVRFSKTDHYIEIFIDGKWETINGINKAQYERLTMRRF